MICKICQGSSDKLFKTEVLNKYIAQYYKCSKCGFMQTEEPYWLNEAYQSAITSLDIGLVKRNLIFSDLIDKIIVNHFDYRGKFLDYAGGYGLFVRLMRDKGFDFFRQDPYCQNLFAQHLDIENLEKKSDFELATAFEVFEHWANPAQDLKDVLSYTKSVLFSTLIQPSQKIVSPNDWWYFIPQTGQHVSFYTIPSLQMLANLVGLNFHTNGVDLHLFTDKTFLYNPLVENSSISIESTSLIRRLLNKVTPSATPINNGKQTAILKNLFEKDMDDALRRLTNMNS